MAGLEYFRLASVEALGAVDVFTVGVLDTAEMQYHSNAVSVVFEIVSLTGTVTTMEGKFYPHLHMSAGDREGRVFGGHLNSATVSATCEMVVRVVDGVVERRRDEEVGLNLFRFV